MVPHIARQTKVSRDSKQGSETANVRLLLNMLKKVLGTACHVNYCVVFTAKRRMFSCNQTGVQKMSEFVLNIGVNLYSEEIKKDPIFLVFLITPHTNFEHHVMVIQRIKMRFCQTSTYYYEISRIHWHDTKLSCKHHVFYLPSVHLLKMPAQKFNFYFAICNVFCEPELPYTEVNVNVLFLCSSWLQQSQQNFLGDFLDLALFLPVSFAYFLYCIKPRPFQNFLLVSKLCSYV